MEQRYINYNKVLKSMFASLHVCVEEYELQYMCILVFVIISPTQWVSKRTFLKILFLFL